DPLGACEIEQTERSMDCRDVAAGFRQRRNRVEHDVARLPLPYERLQLEEMFFRAPRFGANRVHVQQPGLTVWAEVDAHGAQVARDLRRRFIETHVERRLTASTAGGEERARER